MNEDHEFKVGEILYRARIMPNLGICYVQVLKIIDTDGNTVIGVDEVTKVSYLVSKKDFGKTLFTDRMEANNVVDKAINDGKIRKVSKDDGED